MIFIWNVCYLIFKILQKKSIEKHLNSQMHWEMKIEMIKNLPMREQIRRLQRRDSRVRGPHRRNRQPEKSESVFCKY